MKCVFDVGRPLISKSYGQQVKGSGHDLGDAYRS